MVPALSQCLVPGTVSARLSAECSTGHALLKQAAYSHLLPAKLQHKVLQIFGNFQLVAHPHVGGILQVMQEAVLCPPDAAK